MSEDKATPLFFFSEAFKIPFALTSIHRCIEVMHDALNASLKKAMCLKVILL